MSCIVCEDVPVEEFNPDCFTCPICGYKNPIEFVTTDGYLYKCLRCGVWSEDD